MRASSLASRPRSPTDPGWTEQRRLSVGRSHAGQALRAVEQGRTHAMLRWGALQDLARAGRGGQFPSRTHVSHRTSLRRTAKLKRHISDVCSARHLSLSLLATRALEICGPPRLLPACISSGVLASPPQAPSADPDHQKLAFPRPRRRHTTRWGEQMPDHSAARSVPPETASVVVHAPSSLVTVPQIRPAWLRDAPPDSPPASQPRRSRM